MQKGEAKSEQPSVMSFMTPPQEPEHKTSGQSGAHSPPSSASAPAPSPAGTEDSPWRRFLALGKGLTTDTDSSDKARSAVTVSSRARVSPSGTGAASPRHRTPDNLVSPLQQGGIPLASSLGLHAQSPSSSPYESSPHSGKESSLTAQSAHGSTPAISPSSPTEHVPASGLATSTKVGSDMTRTQAQVTQPWVCDAICSLGAAAASLALMAMMFMYALWMLSATGRMAKPAHLSVNTCTTDDCKWHAAYLLDAINSSAEPCQDFEAFACGRREPPPKLRSFDTLLRHHWHVLDVKLMLTRGLRKLPRFAATRKAVAMLLACLHQGSLDDRRRGRQALINFLGDRGLSWPEPSGPVPTSRTLQVLLDLSLNWAVDIWFRLSVFRENARNKFYFREPIVFVKAIHELRQRDEPDGGRERVRLLLQQLRSPSEAMRALLNPHAVDAFVIRLLLDELLVLRSLKNAIRSSGGNGNRLDKLPIKFMESVTAPLPGATWLRLLRHVLNGTSVTVSENDLVFVVNSRLLSIVAKLMVTLHNRLLDQVALWFLQLHADLLPIQPRYMFDRMLFCHAAVELRFGLVVRAEHEANQFNESQRRKIKAVESDVLDQMIAVIKTGSWVPGEAKIKVTAKLENITVNLWHDSRLTDALITRMYSGFPDHASSYVDFWLETGKAQSLWLFEAMRSATAGGVYSEEQYNWGARELQYRNAARDPPLEYDYWANEVLVSPAVFYAPLFYAQATNGIVYSGLGATLARYIAKAFDDKGIDLSVGENQSDWQSDSARKKFLHGARCWQPALEAAMIGYEGLKTQLSHVEALLVDSVRSPWQVFFISLCQPVCGLRAERDLPRAPRGRLCNQLLVNSRRFSSAFNCRIGEEPMAPVSTCRD